VHTRHERMLAEAHSDELTGIANRRAFGRRLSSEVERARRYGHHLSLVLIDLDRFKGVNEAHGHQVGDEVLAETARRLSALVRRGELVARIGGDGLAWLLPETDEAAAAHAADRARSAIARSPFPAAGPLTISAGVADLARAGTPEELVRLADMALMRAKREGRGITRRAAAGA